MSALQIISSLISHSSVSTLFPSFSPMFFHIVNRIDSRWQLFIKLQIVYFAKDCTENRPRFESEGQKIGAAKQRRGPDTFQRESSEPVLYKMVIIEVAVARQAVYAVKFKLIVDRRSRKEFLDG